MKAESSNYIAAAPHSGSATMMSPGASMAPGVPPSSDRIFARREDSRNACSRRRDRGFTMVEVIVAAAILVLMVMMVTTLMISGTAASKYAERQNRATEIVQDLVDGVRNELRSAVRLFGNDATGLAYKARLETWAGVPGITSTLPNVMVSETFKKDVAGSNKTGNEILFARHAWSEEFQTTSSATYRYDIYRLEHYYLKSEGAGPQPGTPFGLNLVRWVSEPLVDASVIDSIAVAADQRDVLTHLLASSPDKQGARHPKTEVVWKLGQDPATVNTFRQIVSGGTMSSSSLSPRPASWTLLRDAAKSSNGLLYFRHHSIATNYSQPSYGVGKFGIVSTTGDGFPHGFEVQMIGPSGARQVLLRMAIVSTNLSGHIAHADMQAIMDARDL